jgi:hypothetical protein
MMKIGSKSGSGSISLRHGSPDPDPYPNVIDPQHWKTVQVYLHLVNFHLLNENSLSGEVGKRDGICCCEWTTYVGSEMLLIPVWRPKK